jgi:hypothetical protein
MGQFAQLDVKREPYIHNQRLELLRVQRDYTTRPGLYWEVFPYLEQEEVKEEPENCRLKKDGKLLPPFWRWVDYTVQRRELLPLVAKDPDFKRVVIVNSAGMGKTITMQWLKAQLVDPLSGCLPVLIEVNRLTGLKNSHEALEEMMFDEIYKKIQGDKRSLERSVELLRKSGKILFLVDALDEASGDLTHLFECLSSSPFWEKCRFVISTRPYALQVLSEYFQKGQWQIMRLLAFDEAQLERYLAVPGEAVSWYRLVKNRGDENLLSLLTNPRVLKYLRQVDYEKLTGDEIKTRADVLFYAMEKAIKESCAKHPGARPINHGEQAKPTQTDIDLIFEILATCAWVLTSLRIKNEQGNYVPNFGVIDSRQMFEHDPYTPLMEQVRLEVWKRVRPKLEKEDSHIKRKDQLFDLLSCLNLGIKSDILQQGMYGLAGATIKFLV